MHATMCIPERVLVHTRDFDAPLSLVWKAWTIPSYLAQWWGGAGSLVTSYYGDLRPEGTFHYRAQSWLGDTLWGKLIFQEIQALSCLVYIDSRTDALGNICPHPLSTIWPLDTLNIITFSELEGRTMLTLKSTPINASKEEFDMFQSSHDAVQCGLARTWKRLDEFLDYSLEIAWTGGKIFWK